jgi:hypothetical protein
VPCRVEGGDGVQAEGSGEERRRCRGSQRHGRWWRVNTEAATAMWEDDGGRTDGELAKVRWKVGWPRFPRPERTGRRIFPSRRIWSDHGAFFHRAVRSPIRLATFPIGHAFL